MKLRLLYSFSPSPFFFCSFPLFSYCLLSVFALSIFLSIILYCEKRACRLQHRCASDVSFTFLFLSFFFHPSIHPSSHLSFLLSMTLFGKVLYGLQQATAHTCSICRDTRRLLMISSYLFISLSFLFSIHPSYRCPSLFFS